MNFPSVAAARGPETRKIGPGYPLDEEPRPGAELCRMALMAALATIGWALPRLGSNYAGPAARSEPLERGGAHAGRGTTWTEGRMTAGWVIALSALPLVFGFTFDLERRSSRLA